jgi:hypothetical protein
MNTKLPKPNPQDLPKTSRAERRKKFNRFKDTAHKCFGKPFTMVGICLRDCLNRDIKCNDCYRFSEFKENNSELPEKK